MLLSSSEHQIGRCIHDHQFHIEEKSVSAKHCNIYRKCASVYLKDTSTNGTFLNWERLTKAGPAENVRHGDLISLCSPPHHGAALTFVFREVSSTHDVCRKRKIEEFVGKNKRLKVIGIGAPEGPISLDDFQNLQQSNTELRKQLESQAITIDNLCSVYHLAVEHYENEKKELKESVAKPYLEQLKEMHCILEGKQEVVESIRYAQNKNMLSKIQKASLVDLKAQLDEEHQRGGEREKAAADLKPAVHTAQSDAQEELKQFSDAATRREREQQEVINKLQVAAGWPDWLSAAAPEATNGWIPRRFDSFHKLDEIGKGVYGCVCKARDLVNGKFVAVKKVRFDYLNPASVRFMAREIVLLRRLDHPNVIKFEELITSRTSSSLYLVFEYMEYDLHPRGINFSQAQVKCYMQQLLSGLDYCHSHGVLHRDLKGSNLLVDKNGILKIGDFGLANFYDQSSSVPQTRGMVSLRYRPPEILLGASKYGVGVDLWSAGCILGELYYGDNILPGTSELEQLHRIYRLCGSPSDEDCWRRLHLGSSSTAVTQRPNPPHRRRVAEIFKDLLPPAALQLMEILLSLYPADRGTAAMALNTDYFLL